MAQSWGIGTPAEQHTPTPTGHQVMIAIIPTAVLSITRSTELPLSAQATSRIVACPILPLLPLLPRPRCRLSEIPMTASHSLHLPPSHHLPHIMHKNAARSDESRSPRQATPMSEHNCHQYRPPGAPTLFHDPRIIMHHAIRLTKTMVPRSVCELRDLSFAAVSSSHTIPSVCVTCGKEYAKQKFKRNVFSCVSIYHTPKMPVSCRRIILSVTFT